MAKYKSYSKRTAFKRTLAIILTCVVLLGCLAASVTLFGSKTKDITGLQFSLGRLDGEGNYVEADDYIFTKNLIECQGLKVEPDLKNTSSYTLYLYDHQKQLTEVIGPSAEDYTLTDTSIQYCRIVVTPEATEEENRKIGYMEKLSLVSLLNITVNRKQDFKVVNYFEADKSDKVADQSLAFVNKEGYGSSKLVSIESVNKLVVSFESAQPTSIEMLFFTKVVGEDGESYEYVSKVETDTAKTVCDVVVPEGATHMIINYMLGEKFEVNAK